MEVNFSQVLKADRPILVSDAGAEKVTEVKPRHSLKALGFILVSDAGKVTEVKLWHQLKASSPILVTPSSITTALILSPQAPLFSVPVPSMVRAPLSSVHVQSPIVPEVCCANATLPVRKSAARRHIFLLAFILINEQRTMNNE
jgi:hypothetical protein